VTATPLPDSIVLVTVGGLSVDISATPEVTVLAIVLGVGAVLSAPALPSPASFGRINDAACRASRLAPETGCNDPALDNTHRTDVWVDATDVKVRKAIASFRFGDHRSGSTPMAGARSTDCPVP